MVDVLNNRFLSVYSVIEIECNMYKEEDYVDRNYCN